MHRVLSKALADAVRDGVLARLPGWAPAEVLLSATHTHSGPGGYSHNLAYNLSILGMQPQALEAFAPGYLAPSGPQERYPQLRWRARR